MRTIMKGTLHTHKYVCVLLFTHTTQVVCGCVTVIAFVANTLCVRARVCVRMKQYVCDAPCTLQKNARFGVRY